MSPWPRLTGSPGLQTAVDWTAKRLQEFGAENAHVEPWGPFKRGRSFSRFEIHLTQPVYAPLHGAPLAWSQGTEGPLRANVIATPFLHEDDSPWDMDITTLNERVQEFRERWAGKLRGKIVLLDTIRDFEQPEDHLSHRLDEKNRRHFLSSLNYLPSKRQTGFLIPCREIPRSAASFSTIFRLKSASIIFTARKRVQQNQYLPPRRRHRRHSTHRQAREQETLFS